jgi:hypothetical protein
MLASRDEVFADRTHVGTVRLRGARRARPWRDAFIGTRGRARAAVSVRGRVPSPKRERDRRECPHDPNSRRR